MAELIKYSKVAKYVEFGGAGVLRLESRLVDELGDGEVVVEIKSSGVNPLDVKRRAGAQGLNMPTEGIVPHTDGAGVVLSIGRRVDSVAIGDRVWVWGVGTETGTSSSIAVVPAERLSPLPDSASFELGATLGIPAVTAAISLNRVSGKTVDLSTFPYANKTVLVRGGGAVGHFTIQLAKWAGARVVVTTTREKASCVQAAGADAVVDREDPSLEDLLREACPGGADVIVDVAPAVNLATNLQIASQRATIAHYGRVGGDVASANFKLLQAKNIELRSIRIVDLPTEELAVSARQVTQALESNALRVGKNAGLPLEAFSLEEIVAAHRAVEDGRQGKVIITFD